MAISKRLRFQILQRDRYQCQMCNTRNARLEVDHKVPVSEGGSDDWSNLWTLCFSCNRGKGTTVVTDIPIDMEQRAKEHKEFREKFFAAGIKIDERGMVTVPR